MTDEQIEKLCACYSLEGLEFYAEYRPAEALYKLWANDFPLCYCRDEAGMRSSFVAARQIFLSCDSGDEISRLKNEIKALRNEADTNAALAMEQKLRADRLEKKLQANLEKAHEHNEQKCKRCMDKTECPEARVRKETAKEIFSELIRTTIQAERQGGACSVEYLKVKARQYGVEVEE